MHGTVCVVGKRSKEATAAGKGVEVERVGGGGGAQVSRVSEGTICNVGEGGGQGGRGRRTEGGIVAVPGAAFVTSGPLGFRR